MARIVANAFDAEFARIFACMKILYHLVIYNRIINQYEDTYDLIRHLRALDISITNEYESYTNR